MVGRRGGSSRGLRRASRLRSHVTEDLMDATAAALAHRMNTLLMEIDLKLIFSLLIY